MRRIDEKFRAFTDERATDPVTGQSSRRSLSSLLNSRRKLTKWELDEVFVGLPQ